MIVTIGFIIGIIYGLYFDISIAFAFVAIFLFVKYRRPIVVTIIISAIVSNTYVVFLNKKYEDFYNSVTNPMEIVAVVVSDKTEHQYYDSYIIKSENKKFILYTKKELQYGDKIEVFATFTEPDETRNYKGFNYKEYLKTQKIYGYLKANTVNVIQKNACNLISTLSYKTRQKIVDNAKQILPAETSGLLIGIMLGDKTYLTEDLIQDFKGSSLSHILAVSGAHISYIILGLTYLCSKSKVPKRVGNSIIIIALVLFMFITDFAPSVVRACIMGILMLFAKVVYRKNDIWTSIAFSLLVILVYNPFLINNIGLQLSYGGTIGIISFSKKISSYLKKIIKNAFLSEAFAVTLSAQIVIFPVMVFNFNTISLTFFISNIIAMPLLGASIILGFINIFISFISFNLAKYLAIILHFILKILIFISNYVANFSISQIVVTTPSILTIIIYYVVVFNWKKTSKKILAILILCILICNFVYTQIPKDFTIYFIDVGQGDSTLIVTKTGKTILIDGGPDETTVFDYLLDRKIKSIDFILISHFDSDHYAGLIKVMQELEVKNILVAHQETYPEELKGNIIKVSAGNRVQIDKNTYLDILWPEENSMFQDNNNSIVAKLVYAEVSILFTGDIDKTIEERLISKYNLSANILKVSHHGSGNSTGNDFVNIVNPQIALIGVGKNNSFGHPNKVVLERLESIKCKTYRTDKNGEITIKVDESGMILGTEKKITLSKTN